jgi:hypothetical protein
MTVKSTTVKKETTKAAPKAVPVVVVPSREKIVNESRLVLPQDIVGFTANFRREAARSVGRIMADPKKLAIFKELLVVFGQYADDRFEHGVIVRDKAVADKATKLLEAEAQALQNADGVIKGKRAHMAKLSEEIAAHDAKMSTTAEVSL